MRRWSMNIDGSASSAISELAPNNSFYVIWVVS